MDCLLQSQVLKKNKDLIGISKILGVQHQSPTSFDTDFVFTKDLEILLNSD
jgi:hypothetical protein